MAGTSRDKINLNEASFDEISQVPGLNSDKAQAIVNHRPFRSWDDVKRVQGLTKDQFNTLKDSCTI
jgi:competence ComEA-like helix-hairpin-helix protein